MSVYANLDAHEGTVSGTVTITLTRKSMKMIIINDSASTDLQYKFNTTESYATLKPSETVSMDFHAKEVLLSGSGPYRIWSYG